MLHIGLERLGIVALAFASAFLVLFIFNSISMNTCLREGVPAASSFGGIPLWPKDEEFAEPRGRRYRQLSKRYLLLFLAFAAGACFCFFTFQHFA